MSKQFRIGNSKDYHAKKREDAQRWAKKKTALIPWSRWNWSDLGATIDPSTMPIIIGAGATKNAQGKFDMTLEFQGTEDGYRAFVEAIGRNPLLSREIQDDEIDLDPEDEYIVVRWREENFSSVRWVYLNALGKVLNQSQGVSKGHGFAGGLADAYGPPFVRALLTAALDAPPEFLGVWVRAVGLVG